MLNLSKADVEGIKIIIALLGMALLLGEYLYYRRRIKASGNSEPGKTYQSVFAILLISLAVFSVGNYYSFSWRVASHNIEAYDLFHYYINSKYFDKLSYDRLYECALVADERHKKKFKHIGMVRNLKTYDMKSRKSVMDDADKCRKLFSKSEWREFKRDVYNIGVHLRRNEAATMFTDRGYNATPAGNFMLSLLTRWSSSTDIQLLNKIDMLLVACAFLAIGWAFGWKVSLFSIIAFTTMWPSRWPLVGHALLRYDWSSALVIGICMTAKKRHMAGGAFIAYAALVRIFPLMFVAGLGLKYLTEVKWKNARSNLRELFIPRYMRFAAGFAACVLLITGASMLMYPPEHYVDSAMNMKEHIKAENLSFQRMGFEIATHYKFETDKKDMRGHGNTARKERIDRHRKFNYIAGFCIMLAMLFFVRKLSDEETLMLGFIIFFFLTSASYYYYVAMLPAFLLHLKNRSNPLHLAALGILFGVGIFSYLTHHLNGFRYVVTAGSSVILLLYCLVVMTFLLHGSLSGRNTKRESA